MREIKFRAWDRLNGKMRYDIKEFVCVNGKICGVRFANFSNEDYQEIKYVDLMQYTGLKDKNGVEIYEGDIVIDWEGIDRYTVVWNKKWACFELKRLTKNNDTDVEIDGLMSCEVIGNIYENPELLKGEEK